MPRGTSAVDYRAHNPTDGGSIPSPATKHGVFMIAINTKISAFQNQEIAANLNWLLILIKFSISGMSA